MAAIPVPEPVRLGRSILLKFLKVQRLTDREINALLRETSAEANRTIRSLPNTYSAQVRRAQIRLAEQQIRMWAEIQRSIQVGAQNSAAAAAELMAQFDKPFLRSMGINPAAWERSQVATARRGILNYLARGVNGIPLSERVYKNSALASGRIDAIINNGLLLGKTAREIAADVARFINPNTPGGVSYAAMRLGRTELNNAFHTTSMEKYAQTPWVDAVKWNLSGSHPRPDECDALAGDVHFRGGGPGEYRKDDVPRKPHPQCFCYIEPIPMSEDAFIRGFNSGRFDSYLDDIMSTPRGVVA